MTMVRTQIELTDEQLEALKRLAHKRGESVAALVRLGVERVLREESAVDVAEHRRRALAAVGRFRSGSRDTSREHDRYLGGRITGGADGSTAQAEPG